MSWSHPRSTKTFSKNQFLSVPYATVSVLIPSMLQFKPHAEVLDVPGSKKGEKLILHLDIHRCLGSACGLRSQWRVMSDGDGEATDAADDVLAVQPKLF